MRSASQVPWVSGPPRCAQVMSMSSTEFSRRSILKNLVLVANPAGRSRRSNIAIGITAVVSDRVDVVVTLLGQRHGAVQAAAPDHDGLAGLEVDKAVGTGAEPQHAAVDDAQLVAVV